MYLMLMIAGILGLGLMMMEKYEGSIKDCNVIDDCVFKLLYPLLYIVSIPLVPLDGYVHVSYLTLVVLVALLVMYLVTYFVSYAFTPHHVIKSMIAQYFTMTRVMMFAGPILIITYGPAMSLLTLVVGLLPSIVLSSMGSKGDQYICTFKPLHESSYKHPMPIAFGVVLGFLMSLIGFWGEVEFIIFASIFKFIVPTILVLSLARIAIEFQYQQIALKPLFGVVIKVLLTAVVVSIMSLLGFSGDTLRIVGLIFLSPSLFFVIIDNQLIDTIEGGIVYLQQSHFWLMMFYAFSILLNPMDGWGVWPILFG